MKRSNPAGETRCRHRIIPSAAVLLTVFAIQQDATCSAAPGAAHDSGPAGVMVTVGPMATVREREGITGGGWAVAFDVSDGARTGRKVVNIYPNHPDDWGKTAGTGASYSLDRGLTWISGPDNSPIDDMVDLWQDQLRDGSLISLGIRVLPDRGKLPEPGNDGSYQGVFAYGISRDQGTTWKMGTATARSSAAIGPIARPLPRIIQNPDGSLLMPAYSWNQQGNAALLLKSNNMGRTWQVASTIATATSVRAAGVPVTMPWFENMVERVADGSLLAVIRTASNSRGALVTARSTDNGATWSAPEKLLAGPQQRIVAGKLPNLCLLPNGVLVLLTAHVRDHCRIYVSTDGTGREWSEAFIITSQSGGNTSMVSVDYDKLLVFTPATGRIACWEVTVTRGDSERLDLQAMHAAGRVDISTDLRARSAVNPAMGILGPIDGSINCSSAAISDPGQTEGSYIIALDRDYNLAAVSLALKIGEPESAEVFLSQDGRRWEQSGVIHRHSVHYAAVRTAFRPQTVARHVRVDLRAPQGPVILGEVALYKSKPQGMARPPKNVRARGSAGAALVSWDAPAGTDPAAHYLVTPVLLRPADGDNDTQIYPYARIKTRTAATQLEVGKVLSRGAAYRFDVATVDREGRISVAASSPEFVAEGNKPAVP